MAQVNRHVDITGDMNRDDVHSAEISSIVDELNRTSDNVESLLNNLSIAAYGTLTYIWDGTIQNNINLRTTLNSTGALSPLVFVNRSDIPGSYYQLPFMINIVNANGDPVIGTLFISGVDVTNSVFFVNLNFPSAGTPKTYTFYYYLISQPPNATAH